MGLDEDVRGDRDVRVRQSGRAVRRRGRGAPQRGERASRRVCLQRYAGGREHGVHRGGRGRARRGICRGVLCAWLCMRRQVIGRRPASQQHAAVGQLRGGRRLAVLSL